MGVGRRSGFPDSQCICVCVHDGELDREDRPDTAGCLSAGIGDQAPGRVDVPGSVSDEIYEMRQPVGKATESSSTPVRFQAMVISLGGKKLMIDATPDALMLLSCS